MYVLLTCVPTYLKGYGFMRTQLLFSNSSRCLSLFSFTSDSSSILPPSISIFFLSFVYLSPPTPFRPYFFFCAVVQLSTLAYILLQLLFFTFLPLWSFSHLMSEVVEKFRVTNILYWPLFGRVTCVCQKRESGCRRSPSVPPLSTLPLVRHHSYYTPIQPLTSQLEANILLNKVIQRQSHFEEHPKEDEGNEFFVFINCFSFSFFLATGSQPEISFKRNGRQPEL